MADMEPPKDEQHEGFRHPEKLQNETPESVLGIYSTGLYLMFGVSAAAGLGAPLSRFLEGAPYKFLNE